MALPLHACTSATCFLGPAVCLYGELVINGSPYRASFAVQGYMDRFTYLLLWVMIRHAIVPIVREALKLMRLCFSVLVFSSAGFRYSAHLLLCVWKLLQALRLRITCAACNLAKDSCCDRQSWALF